MEHVEWAANELCITYTKGGVFAFSVRLHAEQRPVYATMTVGHIIFRKSGPIHNLAEFKSFLAEYSKGPRPRMDHLLLDAIAHYAPLIHDIEITSVQAGENALLVALVHNETNPYDVEITIGQDKSVRAILSTADGKMLRNIDRIEDLAAFHLFLNI